MPIASGDFEWENQFVDGIWTYSSDMIHKGIQACYAALKADVQAKFGTTLTEVGGIGISAMMHGYLPFDKDGKQLAEFRTWRNTETHRSIRLQHPPALEHRTLLSGDLKQRITRWRHRLSDNTRRLHSLETHRPQGHGRRRSFRHVPYRFIH